MGLMEEVRLRVKVKGLVEGMAEREDVCVIVPPPAAPPPGESEGEVVREALGVVDTVAQPEAAGEVDSWAEREALEVTEGELETSEEREGEGEVEVVAVSTGVAVNVTHWVREAMEALTLGERVAVGEWEGLPVAQGEGLSLGERVGVVLGVEVRVGACPEEEGLGEGRGEREGEPVVLGERLSPGEREGERVPVEEGDTLGEGEGEADREGERLELEVREGVRVEEVHTVMELRAVPERVPLGLALGQGLTVWDALGRAERVEVWLTVLLLDRRGEKDMDPEKLALLEAEGAPLPLLDPDTEARGDPVALPGVGDTLGDTEWDTVALPDLLELGGALMDLDAEKQVEREGVGEERADWVERALAVAQ